MIKVYSIDNCPECDELQEWLIRREVDFVSIKVDGVVENKDEASEAMMYSITENKNAFPVVDLSGALMDGAKAKELIGRLKI